MDAVLPLNKLYGLGTSGMSILFFGESMSRLSDYIIGQLAIQGRPITLIDAANSFDPYLIARIGRHRKTDPRILLERIRLSRVFTCHQLVTLLGETLPQLSQGGPLFINGPCNLFYDEQVPLNERRQLFERVAQSLAPLSKNGQGLYLFQRPMAGQVKNLFLGRVLGKYVQLVILVKWGKHGIEGLLHQSNLPKRRARG
jgi:hypothetical protein